MGDQRTRRVAESGSATHAFLMWLLIGTTITAAAALSTVWALPDYHSTDSTTAARPRESDRYTRLAAACDYLDQEAARKALPGGRSRGGDSSAIGADDAVICIWHRPKDKAGPRREVAVEAAIYRADSHDSGAAQAAEAFATSRVQAEEDVPPRLLPRPVAGFGEEAIATPAPFHAGGLQYQIRQGNVVLRVIAAAGKGDSATAQVREAKDEYVRALARYALGKLR